MQIAIEIPDELGQKLMQHDNVQLFVQQAIEKMLSEEQQTQRQSVPPITNSLIGLLAKANINETDYKQHLMDKYL